MEHFDIAIIGTGSGNSILDDRYTEKRVAICEQGTFGGTCLNVGCIPTKMFVYAAEVAQTIRDAKRFGVDATLDGVRWSDIVSRVFGRIDPIAMGGENYRRSSPNVTVYDTHTRFAEPTADGRYTLRTDGGEEFTADQVVIAAGSRVSVPDAIRDCGVDYYTSDTIMRIGELPEHLVIVGGGFVAAEFAHTFSALGTRVSLVIRGGTLLKHCDDTVCERFTDIASKKWEVHNHCNVVGAKPEQLRHHPDDGQRRDVAGRHGAGGDRAGSPTATCSTPSWPVSRSATAASSSTSTNAPLREAFSRSAMSARITSSSTSPTTRCGSSRKTCCWTGTTPAALKQSDHRYVPSAVFTDPQIAMVGLTENQARAQGYNVMVEGAGLRRRRLRMGDGRHHRHREDHRGRRFGADSRRTHHGAPGLVADPADHPGDEFRTRRPGHGARPVLDPSGAAGGHRERATGTLR